MRKQRNMGEQGMLYSPYAIMDVFAIGEVVVGSEKNITEKYATKAGIWTGTTLVGDLVTYWSISISGPYDSSVAHIPVLIIGSTIAYGA